MPLADDFIPGRFVPGDSLLHRLDPRLKLVGLPLLVIAAFAAPGPERLVLLAVTAGGLVLLSGRHGHRLWRGLWMLRWLLLGTVLLHLFFSPGRTLLGVAWLSLDGLERGLLVCGQLILTVLFSSLLALTTSTEELAAALAAVLAPLARLGLPVRELDRSLLLVLRFFPILREEAAILLASCRQDGVDPGRGSLAARGRAMARLAAPLVLRLADRAEALARAAAGGEAIVARPSPLPPLRRLGRENAGALAVGALLLALIFLLPR